LMRGRVQTGLLQALMEAAEIKDYRGKFYWENLNTRIVMAPFGPLLFLTTGA
jgi:hypothetical protein